MITSLKQRLSAAVSAFLSHRPAPRSAPPAMPRHELERAAASILGPGCSFLGLTDREIQERTLYAAFANPLQLQSLREKSDHSIRKSFESVVRERAADMCAEHLKAT